MQPADANVLLVAFAAAHACTGVSLALGGGAA